MSPFVSCAIALSLPCSPLLSKELNPNEFIERRTREIVRRPQLLRESMSLLGQAREAYVKKNYSEASKLYEKSIHLLFKQNNKRFKAQLAFLTESLAQSSRAEPFSKKDWSQEELESFAKRLTTRAAIAPSESFGDILAIILPSLSQQQRHSIHRAFLNNLIQAYQTREMNAKAIEKCRHALSLFPKDIELNSLLHSIDPT